MPASIKTMGCITTFLIACICAVSHAEQKSNTQSPIPAASNQRTSEADLKQTIHLIKLDELQQKLQSIQAKRSCKDPATLEELSTRQDIMEAIQISVLDVDSVLAELSNERGELSNLRATLQARRDRTVSRLNAAALITGAGLGTAVSATQFTNLTSTTQNVGDGIGVGAGALSTVFSILAIHHQHGPKGEVGQTPNMLAPLLGGDPVLNTYYPPEVIEYLQSVPANTDPSLGTRLERLKSEWVQSGRLATSGSAQSQRKLEALTSSEDDQVKVSISDLSDRIAMLEDVSGRVSLLKRDVAVLARSFQQKQESCKR